ncbi:MAG: 5'/3'-nucleotidase SurE [Pseudomonadota bacterium]
MKILLTNDDGYQAPGILALYEELRSEHEIVLAAPDRERSAVGHSITLNESLRIATIPLNGKDKGYAISGTPADCVKLGLFKFFQEPPDLVISGINAGSNTGVNINYSGTVGAAREAALNGLLSMAVSIKRGEIMDFRGTSRLVSSMAAKLLQTGLPRGTFLNINVPDIPLDDVQGTRITRLSATNLSTQFERRKDPRNRTYYWYGRMDQVQVDRDTDEDALADNHISITPIHCDMTDYKTLVELERFSGGLLT